MTLFLLITYFILVSAIGYTVNRLMSPVFGRGWRLFVAPGVIAHELAHALACVLTGAHVFEINFWKPSGGHVLHGPPRLHLIGPVLISLAPTLVMTVAMFALAPLVAGSLGAITWTANPPANVMELVGGYTAAIAHAVISLPWLSFGPWLLVYAMLNVAVTMAPSRVDLEGSKWAILALIILVLVIGQLFQISIPLDFLWTPIATSLVLLGIALLAAVIVRFGVFILGRR